MVVCACFEDFDNSQLYLSSESFEGAWGDEDIFVADTFGGTKAKPVNPTPGAWTKTGELAELGDIKGFTDGLIRLAWDPARRATFGKAGRERCLVEFDHRVMVDRLDKLYRRLVPVREK